MTDRPKPKGKPRKRLTPEQLRYITILRGWGYSMQSIGDLLGVTHVCIFYALQRVAGTEKPRLPKRSGACSGAVGS